MRPGRLTVCGEAIDLNLVDLPVYIYGSREDHIVPIDAAYASTQVLPGKKRFAMGASGHIAGVINPPSKKKRSHWLREDGQLPGTLAICVVVWNWPLITAVFAPARCSPMGSKWAGAGRR
ncbi:hypothetical protein QUF31_21455 [Dickeya chrysanthemi]|uniref:hypothetical protein n=1 Tax=Dickeya chrysanthemi TaxID=556 RepID=UPI0025A30264|nr:hypothetical protein [Dickeya chrysanthemi]WJM85521.1 hypothetical protein QUF31_21455 [Dickeya chrysanthemi]